MPAFVGLGAPYWDAYARGTLIGLTRGTGLAEIARAAIDAMAYQVADVVAAMAPTPGIASTSSASTAARRATIGLCQFQADLLGVPVERPVHAETTALGAAALAGLAVGVWPDAGRRSRRPGAVDRRFEPAMDPDRRAAPAPRLAPGRRAVAQLGRARAELTGARSRAASRIRRSERGPFSPLYRPRMRAYTPTIKRHGWAVTRARSSTTDSSHG